jgi:shikimate dehydrogenase
MRLCLIGRAIAGSPSRLMHEAFMRSTGIAGTYELCDIEAAELSALLKRVRAGEYGGCNVTMPYKAAVAAACDELEADGALLGVVNTLTPREGRIIGGNTDAAGLERALREGQLAPAAGFRALVFGAGGAATAACLAMDRLGAGEVVLVARRPARGEAVADRLRARSRFQVVEWSSAAVERFLDSAGIAVNATPVGLSSLPFHPRLLPASCTVADVRYRPVPIDVVAAAEETGHRATDGREMLLQQGVLSFERWTGRVPALEPARRSLEEALG